MIRSRSQDSKGDEGGVGKFIALLVAGIFALILITIIVPNVLGVSVNYFCITPESVLNGMTTNYCVVDGDGVATGPAADNVFLPDAVRTTAGDLISTSFIAVSIGIILVGAVKILQYRIVAQIPKSEKSTIAA
ncbi:MAG: hypothetical protein OEL52_01195 [Nitrosopumilus sp.]|nr:hypothetical protein [Nitrosopumilus sp.]